MPELSVVKVEQTKTFAKIIKKLKSNHRIELEIAVKKIIENPQIGVAKVGDLGDVRVLNFKINKQLYLLAYMYNPIKELITLLALGSHENFYKKLKR